MHPVQQDTGNDFAPGLALQGGPLCSSLTQQGIDGIRAGQPDGIGLRGMVRALGSWYAQNGGTRIRVIERVF